MATPMSGLVRLHISEIHPSPRNPRDQLVDIEDLALSIREQGLIQPIVVQRRGATEVDGYQIVAGHRRFAAILRLGWLEVPALVQRQRRPDEELLAMIVENGQRANLDPIEEAYAYKRLQTMGLTHAQIARRVGRSVATINGRLMLLTLPAEDQEEIRAGASTVSRGLELIRAERAREREAENPVARPVGRPKGAKTKPYFGDTHPLARTVRTRCDHRGTPKVGGVGCGQCWEAAIRLDDRAQQKQVSA